jgi:hypothetical protein
MAADGGDDVRSEGTDARKQMSECIEDASTYDYM